MSNKTFLDRMDIESFRAELTPQTARLFDYLHSGRHITQMIAFVNMGIGSLTSRVSELRKALKKFGRAECVTDEIRFDSSGRRFKSYWMERSK